MDLSSYQVRTEVQWFLHLLPAFHMHSTTSQHTPRGSAWIAVVTEDTTALARINTEHNLLIWRDLRGRLLITRLQIFVVLSMPCSWPVHLLLPITSGTQGPSQGLYSSIFSNLFY